MAPTDRFEPLTPGQRRISSGTVLPNGGIGAVPRQRSQRGITPPPAGSKGGSPEMQAYVAAFKAVQSGVALHRANVSGTATQEQKAEHNANMNLVAYFHPHPNSELLSSVHAMIQGHIRKEDARQRKDKAEVKKWDTVIKQAHANLRTFLFNEEPKDLLSLGNGTISVKPKPVKPKNGPVTVTQGTPKPKSKAKKSAKSTKKKTGK